MINGKCQMEKGLRHRRLITTRRSEAEAQRYSPPVKDSVMIKTLLASIVIATLGANVFSFSLAPPPDAFTVLKQTPAPGPRITPYLKYQTEQAWREDELRRRALE